MLADRLRMRLGVRFRLGSMMVVGVRHSSDRLAMTLPLHGWAEPLMPFGMGGR